MSGDGICLESLEKILETITAEVAMSIVCICCCFQCSAVSGPHSVCLSGYAASEDLDVDSMRNRIQALLKQNYGALNYLKRRST